MNNDLISRYALKKAFDEYGEKAKFTQGACQQLIDNAPPIEYTFEKAFQKTVCEQKLYCPSRTHGEWIHHEEWENEGGCGYECSCCGRTYDYDMNFCGYCGAKMDGGADDDK